MSLTYQSFTYLSITTYKNQLIKPTELRVDGSRLPAEASHRADRGFMIRIHNLLALKVDISGQMKSRPHTSLHPQMVV